MKAIFILIVIQMQLLVEVFSINPIVETNVGTIRGLQSSDGDYDMFLGIPYANVDKKYPFRVSIYGYITITNSVLENEVLE